MSRINTNVSAMIGSRVLASNTSKLNSSLERLSTGLRINRGSDDPAGLIASENLRRQIAGTEAAVKNSERTINIISTAEGSLSEVSALLLDVQSMLTEAANKGGMSTEELDANQLQVDSILNSIDRIANTSEFNGVKLLNGNLAYTTSSISGTYIDDIDVNTAKLIDGATMKVSLKLNTAADTGRLRLSGAGTSGSTPMTIQIGSNRGTTELTFAGSTKISAIVYAINQVKEVTGVSAALSGATVAANLRSVDYGADAYVSVEVLNGSQGTKLAVKKMTGAHNDSQQDYGVDAVATVNGASATADGKTLTIRTAMLDAKIELDGTAAMSATSWTTTFGITSGGADFALGATVEATALEAIGLPNIASSSLGSAGAGGYLNTLRSGSTNALTSDNLYTAQRIVDQAIKDISRLRGRLGSFQKNTVETTINQLNITKENLSSAESAIRDTDFATETAEMTRAQILVQSSTQVLAQANYAPQTVLSLLG